MAIKDLVVSRAQVGETVVEGVLRPYMRFVEDGGFSPESKFWDLKADEKIAVALIAQDAQRYLDDRAGAVLGLKNEDLERVTQLPGNTVRPKLKELRDDGLVVTKNSVHFATAKLIHWARKLEAVSSEA